MKKANKGFFIPYTMFILILVLNIFIFVILCSLNTNNYYEDKVNYYQIFILEERAKRHIKTVIDNNLVNDYDQEQIFYDEDFLFLTYELDEKNQIWKISLRIYYHNINEFAIILYDLKTNELSYTTR